MYHQVNLSLRFFHHAPLTKVLFDLFATKTLSCSSTVKFEYTNVGSMTCLYKSSISLWLIAPGLQKLNIPCNDKTNATASQVLCCMQMLQRRRCAQNARSGALNLLGASEAKNDAKTNPTTVSRFNTLASKPGYAIRTAHGTRSSCCAFTPYGYYFVLSYLSFSRSLFSGPKMAKQTQPGHTSTVPRMCCSSSSLTCNFRSAMIRDTGRRSVSTVMELGTLTTCCRKELRQPREASNQPAACAVTNGKTRSTRNASSRQPWERSASTSTAAV